MKKILILFLGLIIINNSFGQDKMIVDKPFNGNTFYGGFSKQIDCLSDLPNCDSIQYKWILTEDFRNDE